MVWITLLGLSVVAVLGWQMYRRLGADRLQAFNDKRRGSSRLVAQGEFVDGNRRMPVALALNNSTLFYENSDMSAYVDLEWMTEIDYVSELATGAPIAGREVLRMRSKNQTFEFLLAQDTVDRWRLVLPPRRLDTAVA